MHIERALSRRLLNFIFVWAVALAPGCGTASTRAEPAAASVQMRQQPALAAWASESQPASAEAAPPSPPAESESLRAGVASTSKSGAQDGAGLKRADVNKSKISTVENSEGTAANATREPLLIYRADVILAVFEVNKGLDAVERIAKEAQGYLVRRTQDTITVRVPAAGFDGSLQAILKLGDVLQRNLQVDDVTAEMNDLTTRLKNAEAMRARLEQLLSSAKNTEEALKVEEQLGRVTGEIESIKGKLRLMRELVSFSTITVSFQPATTEKVNSKFKLPFGWLNDLGLSKLLSL